MRYENILKSADREVLDPEQKDFLQDEFNIEHTMTHISGSETKIKQTFPLAGKGTIQQKIRVCEVTTPLFSIKSL